MGMAKKDSEKQEYEFLHTGEYCERCGCELTQDDVDYIKKVGGQKLCAACRAEWDKTQKQ